MLIMLSLGLKFGNNWAICMLGKIFMSSPDSSDFMKQWPVIIMPVFCVSMIRMAFGRYISCVNKLIFAFSWLALRICHNYFNVCRSGYYQKFLYSVFFRHPHFTNIDLQTCLMYHEHYMATQLPSEKLFHSERFKTVK